MLIQKRTMNYSALPEILPYNFATDPVDFIISFPHELQVIDVEA